MSDIPYTLALYPCSMLHYSVCLFSGLTHLAHSPQGRATLRACVSQPDRRARARLLARPHHGLYPITLTCVFLAGLKTRTPKIGSRACGGGGSPRAAPTTRFCVVLGACIVAGVAVLRLQAGQGPPSPSRSSMVAGRLMGAGRGLMPALDYLATAVIGDNPVLTACLQCVREP